MNLPAAAHVIEAAERVRPHVIRTPLLGSPALDARVGGRLLVKAECLQHTGSFKIRGACNRMLLMSPSERRAGVVAWSAGNHGQAVAFVGQSLGVPVTVVMPADAPQAKIEGTRRWGARLVLYDRHTEVREEIGRDIATRTGAVIVPPYDDADIIAGQGVAGLEAIEDARSAGAPPDRLLCPTGGGGLIAGCALAADALGQGLDLHPVEPHCYDDTGRSIAAGFRVSNDGSAASICDALMTVTPGALPFAVNHGRLAPGLAVTDAQVEEAVRTALRDLKIVLEPGGAAGLAAALFRPDITQGVTTIVMATGGNLDLSRLASIIGHAGTRPDEEQTL